ncbi:hypothetical protein [Intrasporangium calvum]|uniref:hypothetical protein n=1 Tax=Intrasporangium calvum TaxID=53358 RepID=UPI000DF6089F|nr:hypothetical protein [Intrasporangium calvum]AXG14430.1 hypothetical protein DN585_14355 [Intrasporangium calvum]
MAYTDEPMALEGVRLEFPYASPFVNLETVLMWLNGVQAAWDLACRVAAIEEADAAAVPESRREPGPPSLDLRSISTQPTFSLELVQRGPRLGGPGAAAAIFADVVSQPEVFGQALSAAIDSFAVDMDGPRSNRTLRVASDEERKAIARLPLATVVQALWLQES